MILVCPECGTENRIPDPPEPTKTYRCGKCNTRLTSIPKTPVVSNSQQLTLPAFLGMAPVMKVVEKPLFGKTY